MYDYVLQLGFDKETEDFIQDIKNTLKENGVEDKEKNWRPHITVDLYNCDNKESFVKEVDEIIKEIRSFEIKFNNLNNFNEKTLYIEPFNKTELIDIKNTFDNRLNKYRLESRLSKIYKPHATLCTNEDLRKAKTISDDKFKAIVGKVSYLWIYNPKVELIKEYELK